MDFNVEVRKKQLESLENFISTSYSKIQSVLDDLGWTESEVLKDESYIKCSVDPSHRVPKKSVDGHIKKCSIKREGYDLKEPFLSEPTHDTKYSITIDDHKKIEIFASAARKIPGFKRGWNGQDPDPQTSDRLMTTFTPDERAALYDYAIKHTESPPKLPEFNITLPEPKSDKPLTTEEKLALERDAKRRRAKYKSVHTNKKNYTEIMREVINGQMDLYKEWVEAGSKDKSEHTEKTEVEPELDSGYAQSTSSTRSGRSRSRSRKREHRHSSRERSKHRSSRKDYDDHYHKHRDHHRRYSRSPSRRHHSDNRRNGDRERHKR